MEKTYTDGVRDAINALEAFEKEYFLDKGDSYVKTVEKENVIVAIRRFKPILQALIPAEAEEPAAEKKGKKKG